jgi:hypothetical protein
MARCLATMPQLLGRGDCCLEQVDYKKLLKTLKFLFDECIAYSAALAKQIEQNSVYYFGRRLF